MTQIPLKGHIGKFISKVMNKGRTPKIPPLLVNNVFILDCKEKAKLFNDL